ncbi:uncharacterized protein N7498_005067 [Penicillium cinerascens]|uniref:Zn(2)-C6 fungal-type domain-containing protein n=1 Tax=Penicillium cinerascens TaxID=70096 RepID=A0A9W9MMQ3_9EURO|nr:uncharacterized protein N7498_005067 [Penicillium cinerascens]KAJ5204188.1 hypothetical protein N7498_005067 [Penicillium cinerascens]
MTLTTFHDTGWSIQSPPQVPAHASPVQKKGRRQTGTPWTRSGCLTCKKRRKGCDKAKPNCNNCLKQGRKCEGYGDLWVAPLGPSAQVFMQADAPKRRLTSSTPPHLPSPPPSVSPYSDASQDARLSPVSLGWSVPPSPQRIVETEAEETAQDQDVNGTTGSTSQNALSVILRPRGYPNHLSGHESHYLQYHVEYGSKLLANLESDDNPLRSLLIPYAMSSPLLMKAVCAVSALHLANRSQEFSAQNAAATFYGRTLSGLQTVLAKCPTNVLPDDAMLAVGLMCKYEIVRGSVKQWVVHLSAMQRLIASRGGLGSMDPDAAQFLRGLFVYAYNMARISNRKRITFSDPTDTDISSPKLDIYIGYTEEILKLCGRIAELPSLQDDNISLRLAIASINDSLLTWTPTSIRYIIPRGITPAALTRLQLVAECFRDAAFVYLHSTLERMSMNSDHFKAPTNHPDALSPACLFENSPYITEWAPLISTPKSTAIYRCLARVESFPLDDHCEYSALTFPLFISGCESDVFAHRDLIIRSLGKLQFNFGIGNVERAKEVLRVLWARQDANAQDVAAGGSASRKTHWVDILEELQWELILA